MNSGHLAAIECATESVMCLVDLLETLGIKVADAEHINDDDVDAFVHRMRI